MKKVIFLSVIFLICTSVHAKPVIVMDKDSGRIIYGSDIHDRELIASTTKIMTSLVVLNNSNLDKVVTVGDEVTKAYGSAIYIKPMEKLTIKDLLYGLMLRSGNDAALVLAKNVGGSIDGFVKLMNDTAYNLGMKDTTFNNPSGLDEESENKSSVYDMALLMREAMNNKYFRKITSTEKYTLRTNFNTYIWYNKNKLLSKYKYATGGKIGYTKRARHTFVSSASKNGKNLIIASFKDDDIFKTHEELYEKFFGELKKYRVVDKNNLGIKYKPKYDVYTLDNFDMLLRKDEKDKVQTIVTIYDNIKCSNTCIIGRLNIKFNNKIYKEMNLYSRYTGRDKGNFFKKIRFYTKKLF